MLSNPADALEPGAVRGIAQLVASSVKGLKTENVTITDSTGALLWPNGDSAGAAPGGSNKQAAEARYARGLEASLTAMLARTLGPGKAQVQVNADLNVDKTTKDELTYGKKGVPLKTTEETEKLRGSGSARGGTAGTGSNIPDLLRPAPAARQRQQQLRPQERLDRLRGRQDGLQDRGRARRGQQDAGRAAGRQVGPRRRRSPASRRPSQSAAGVDSTRGDTSSRPSRCRSPRSTTPKAGPVPTGCSGR